MADLNSSQISRRGFLKGALASSAGLATFAIAGCENTPTVPANSDDNATWDMEADIVILGMGCAGCGAAIEAAEEDADVLILEKMTQELAGGNSTIFGGNITPLTAEGLMASSMGTMPKEKADAWAPYHAETLKFMKDLGVPYNGTNVEGGAVEFYRIFIEAVKDYKNVRVEYEVAAKSLIQDSKTKEVHGVIAVKGGQELRVKAKKAVIVATGGFEANQTMLQSLYLPSVPLPTVGSPANIGEGIEMCAQIGAKIDDVAQCLEYYEFAFRKASDEWGSAITSRWWTISDLVTGEDSSPIHDSKIYVNYKGKRFINEKRYLCHSKSQLSFTDFQGDLWDTVKDYLNLPAFWVCDDTCIKSGPIGNQPEDVVSTWASVFGLNKWSDDNSAEIEKGWIVKADTIEELASKMAYTTYATGESGTVDPETLKQTIATYNEYCANGEDPEFGKPARSLKPIMTSPFYAVEICPTSLYTVGGLLTDGQSRVLDWNDKPIPRLYAAGNIAQGVKLFVIGIAGCVGNGRIAGLDAATLDSWS